MQVDLIGVDVATRAARTGLAVGRWGPRGLTVDSVAPTATADELCAALARCSGPTLVCLDAPLGWPLALAPALTEHRAGEPIAVPRDRLFWRETDRVVRQETGKRPLSVAADLIAHTAWQALSLLAALRATRPLPVLTDPAELSANPAAGGAIEVYPGAALVALGVPARGYKAARARDLRASMLEPLAAAGLRLSSEAAAAAVGSADALDAALCLLVGACFLEGGCVHWRDHGVDSSVVRREGWMWAPVAAASTSR